MSYYNEMDIVYDENRQRALSKVESMLLRNPNLYIKNRWINDVSLGRYFVVGDDGELVEVTQEFALIAGGKMVGDLLEEHIVCLRIDIGLRLNYLLSVQHVRHYLPLDEDVYR